MRKHLKVIILVVVVLFVIIGAILVKNLVGNTDKNGAAVVSEETNDYKSIFNKSESDSEQKVDISSIESIDHEIAKILFSEYFKNEFNEKLITEAKYDTKEKEFTCTYVTKIHDNSDDKDFVELTTEDFITYQQNKTEYTYNKKYKMNTAHGYSGRYTDISNVSKNRIIELAKNKGYYTGRNLTDKEYERILEIVFDNDKKDLEKNIKNNNYELKNYYITDGAINYIFNQKDNDKYYIKISSSASGVWAFPVYGITINEIYENSRYSDLSGGYVVDYYIRIEKELNELEEIYSKIKINKEEIE